MANSPSALPVDDEVAASHGRLVAAAAGNGRQPRSRVFDLLIAATAHTHNARLYTCNPADLVRIEDLVEIVPVRNPSVPRTGLQSPPTREWITQKLARRRGYETARLSITYDHPGKRAKLHTSPNPEVWSSVRVGGASRTPSTRAPWSVELRAA